MRPSRSSLLPLPVCSLIVGMLTLVLASPMAQAQNGRTILITQSVDESKLVTLAGNTRPEANKQNDRGLVADDLSMEHMQLQLKRSPAQERALLQYIEELQTPSSPNFHHWLTAKQYGEKFGLATQDLDALTHWLESHGFKVNLIYENGILIDFSGTAGAVRSAFHTEIHQLDVKGVKHFANMSDPRIPAALAPAMVGVVSLHDFKPHTNYKPRSNYTVGANEFLVVPGDLAIIYNLNPLFTASISGQGQTIAVIEDTDLFATSDWTNFRSAFGLTLYTDGSLTQVHPAPVNGPNNCADPGVNGDDGEAIIDAEYASAAAPSATIEVASCEDTETTFGGLIAVQNLLNGASAPPAIMSISYGECEAFNGASSNAAYNSAYQQAVTEGVSVFVSTGDEGAASCDANQTVATHGVGVSAFASTPYNVAVGGTDFSDTFSGTTGTYWSATNSPTFESALSYVPEIPWNDSCASFIAAEFFDFTQTYGTDGFCNSSIGEDNLTVSSGSGGPSGCATGSTSVFGSGVVSGTCKGWPKPSFQSVFGNPSDTVRDTPDVSLFAGNGIWGHFYPYCFTDPDNGGKSCAGVPSTWPGAGGTSFASPIMAGIQALVNQKVGVRQGNPNTVYYSLAATEYGASGNSSCSSTLGNTVGSSCIFYDVTEGDMDVNCTGSNSCYLPSGANGVLSTSNSAYQPAFATTTGWDFATGIGTVNAANLANAWPSIGTTPTTTTLTSNHNPQIQGGSVTFTATVSTTGANAPTGNVNFNDGETIIGSGTLNGSQVATFTTTTLAVGTHSITAVYGGDMNDAGSTSAPVSQVITAIDTTTTLTSNHISASQGVPVTLTATVATSGSHAPTGTVTFNNGTTLLSTVNLTGLTAAFTTSTLPVGTNSITATYNGDVNNSPSTSTPLSQVITPPTFTVSNPTAPNPGTVLSGQSTVSTFTVTPTSGSAFAANVTFACNGLPDTTVSCSFNTGAGQANPQQIAAGTVGAVPVTLTISTTGPNQPAEAIRRRTADNRFPWLPLSLPLAGIIMVGVAGRKMSKHSALAGLCVTLLLLGLLVACGGSSSPPITVFVNQGVPPSVFPNYTTNIPADNWPVQTAQFAATVGNTSNTAVTWAVTTPGGGSIDQTGLYTAPMIAAGLPTTVTITATSMADSTKVGSAQETLKLATIPDTYSITVTATEGATQVTTTPAIALVVN